MKSKILVTLAVLAVMASVSHAMPWLCGGWVKVNGTYLNGVTITCIENGLNNVSADGIDFRVAPPQVHAGYFILNCEVRPPAGTYTVCFRYGNYWKHVTFTYDGSNQVNLGDISVDNTGPHPRHLITQQQQ